MMCIWLIDAYRHFFSERPCPENCRSKRCLSTSHSPILGPLCKRPKRLDNASLRLLMFVVPHSVLQPPWLCCDLRGSSCRCHTYTVHAGVLHIRYPFCAAEPLYAMLDGRVMRTIRALTKAFARKIRLHAT